MPVMENGDVRIRYDEQGEGFPVLTFSPGGLRSTIEAWSNAPWDVPGALVGNHRVITMDQRNAGPESFAPVHADDGWGVYADDQIALLDHLGIERCHLVGMCIGGSFIASLLERAPERVAAAAVLQPIGLDDNRDAFLGRFDEFAEGEASRHPEAAEADWAGFREHLYGGDATLWSVPDAVVATFTTPLLVFAGGDEPHPASASTMLAATAPDATLIERWKAPEFTDAARDAIANFLSVHTPDGGTR